ncbi:MAG: hypothetical protein ACPGU9_08170 [Flavobacteriaceae bacterium]
MNYTELEQKITENRSVDFGDIFNKSFELFKKTWQQGLLHMLLSIGVALAVMAIVFVPLFVVGVVDASAFESLESGDPDFSGIIMLYLVMFPAIFITVTFSTLINAAFYRIVKQIDLGESMSSASFGMFFKSQYIVKAFVLSLITMLIAIVATLACYLPLFYVMIPLTFVVVIFAFNPDLSTSDIISLSFKLGTKKWLVTFGLVIVATILAEVVGLMLCGIGIFVTASFIYLPTYYIYKEVVGFDDSSNSVEIEE